MESGVECADVVHGDYFMGHSARIGPGAGRGWAWRGETWRRLGAATGLEGEAPGWLAGHSGGAKWRRR